MRPSDAVRNAVDALVPLPEIPTTFAGFIAAFGDDRGLTRRIAEATGVSMRTVQRWRRSLDPDFTGQIRRPSEAHMDSLRALSTERAVSERRRLLPIGRGLVLDQMAAQGLTVETFDGNTLVSTDERWRTVSGIFIRPGLAAGFVDNARGGRWGSAADELAQAWGIAYGIGRGVRWLEVDDLSLRIG